MRRHLRLPRHSTANDDAAILLRIAGSGVVAALLTMLFAHWLAGRTAMFTASSFVGLALQQYAWYTGRIYTECWADEGIPVVATVGLSSLLIGLISLLFSILLSGLLRVVLLGGLHVAFLFSFRWGGIWGSLFDVRMQRANSLPTCITIAHTHPSGDSFAYARHCTGHRQAAQCQGWERGRAQRTRGVQVLRRLACPRGHQCWPSRRKMSTCRARPSRYTGWGLWGRLRQLAHCIRHGGRG